MIREQDVISHSSIKCSLWAIEEQFMFKRLVSRNQNLDLRNLLIVIIPFKSSHSQTKLSMRVHKGVL
uniref:Uncharacterized protein n=1 Tax=Cucumis sativus TaxID=3659 RepID=A0A0A0KDE3_CUCSA